MYLLNKKIKAGPYDENVESGRPLQEAMVGIVESKE
jgi:hypothetical protein